MLRASTSAYAD